MPISNNTPAGVDPTLARVISSQGAAIKGIAANCNDTSYSALGIEILKNIVFGILSGGIYSLYSIGSSLHAMYTADQKMREEGESVDQLLLAVGNLDANSNEVKFKFKGQDNTLADEKINGKDCLVLKDHAGEIQHVFEGNSLAELRQRVSLFKIYGQLTPDAKKAFLPLFNLPVVGSVSAKSPIVSGDLDGSTARQVLLGIQAGMIEINDEGRACLVRIMNEEAKALKSVNHRDGIVDKILQINMDEHEQRKLVNDKKDALLDFQGNAAVQKDMEELANSLVYKPGHTLLISIGDGMHDRFSNNKDEDRRIREQMHLNGAIYITGNHDVYSGPGSWQFGKWAKTTATPQDWKVHQDKVLSNAFFQKETNTLYLHHGIEEDMAGNIMTAFGTYEVPETGFDLDNFLTWINSDERRPPPNSMVQATGGMTRQKAREANEGRHEYLSNFKPKDASMQPLAEKLKIRIVHGHSGVAGSSHANILGLNARVEDDLLAVVAVRVGENEPATRGFDRHAIAV